MNNTVVMGVAYSTRRLVNRALEIHKNVATTRTLLNMQDIKGKKPKKPLHFV